MLVEKGVVKRGGGEEEAPLRKCFGFPYEQYVLWGIQPACKLIIKKVSFDGYIQNGTAV